MSLGTCVPIFPRYGMAFIKYFVLLSLQSIIFIPYFAGLLGIYILNGHLPLKASSCSSTVTASYGIYIFLQLFMKIFHMFLIEANLSFLYLASLVSWLSKRRQHKRN